MGKTARRRRETKKAPKYQRVYESLRSKIADGTYPPGELLPSDTELPKQLRVSTITVRRALDELQREGLIVRRRGKGTYVADPNGRSHDATRDLRLGVLLGASVTTELLTRSFVGSMTKGALSEWGLADLDPVIPLVQEHEVTRAVWKAPERRLTGECVGKSLQSFMRHPPFRILQGESFDGMLLLSIIDDPFIEKLIKSGTPLVIVDYPNDRFTDCADHVYLDPLPGYRAAMRHMVGKGLQRVHFVGALVNVGAPTEFMTHEELVRHWQKVGVIEEPDNFLRLSAYRQVMDENGLQVPQSWIHFASFDAEGSLRPLARQLIALPEADRPQAVVCHGRSQAEAMIDEFARHGHSIEGVGADDEAPKGRAHAVVADPVKMGKIAASLLIDRLERPERPYLDIGVKMTFKLSSTAGTAKASS